jgi:hypothetical protein
MSFQNFTHRPQRHNTRNTVKDSDAQLPTHLAHPLEDDCAVAIHVLGPPLQGQRQNCGELGRLLPVDIPGRGSVVVAASRLCAVNARTPFNYIEIQLENALLAEHQFSHRDKRELGALAEDRAAGSEEQVFYELLRKRGPAANARSFHIAFRGNFHRVPIESMMLVKARVFRGDNRMLEIARDLAQRNEFVSFVIWRAANPGLRAPLHVHRGRRRVDPPGSHKHQRGQRPKKRHSDENPSNEGSEMAFPKRGIGLRGWSFSHISE